MGNEVRESPKATLLGTLAGWVMRLWCATLRFEIEDRAGLGKSDGIQGPVIYALWHNRIFVVPAAWRRLCGRSRKCVVLTSASHDGAMLARAVGVFGLGSVRGSSSRRGAAALVALRKALRKGDDACVTPDGPRGPRYSLQPGVVKVSEASTAPVIPIHVEFASAWRLKSWDRFHLPKPFSRVRVIFDEALAVPAGLSDAAFEAWRDRVEAVLRSGVEDFHEES
ncbi:lysophospholipid acyltransferase family protein [Haloferula sp. A504]|uniref:lysophospholipid acyltransferase family protein n=1 Tax=Haloferula sp. A504 TaxID=3373601 RepID=UPI0031C9D47A|nr:lysophospholipid acyltransferase family protein [Verrucomicrobiaceae bacterium E54]